MTYRIAFSVPLSVTDAELAIFDGLDVEISSFHGTSPEIILANASDADAIVVGVEHFPRDVLEKLPRLRSLTRLGIGVDTLDLDAAAELGIWCTNVPDANYREVAVHAVAMALSLTRRLAAFDNAIKTTGWANTFEIGAGMRRPDDQVFGLLGLGRIGQRVAIMASAIGYRVIAHDPLLTRERAAELGVTAVSFDELLESSNILSLHVPYTEANRHIIDAQALRRLPLGAVVVNVSRGGLIDEDALADAIVSGHIAGAGIDTFQNEPLEPGSPLRSLDRVLLSPHAAHNSLESMAETKRKALEDVARVLRGETPVYPVNSPNAEALQRRIG